MQVGMREGRGGEKVSEYEPEKVLGLCSNSSSGLDYCQPLGITVLWEEKRDRHTDLFSS